MIDAEDIEAARLAMIRAFQSGAPRLRTSARQADDAQLGMAGGSRAAEVIAVPRYPEDVPASADPSPPFEDDLGDMPEIPECLRRT